MDFHRQNRNHQIAMNGGNWIPPDYFEVDEPDEQECGETGGKCEHCGECEQTE
jgi:hypothetical protein